MSWLVGFVRDSGVFANPCPGDTVGTCTMVVVAVQGAPSFTIVRALTQKRRPSRKIRHRHSGSGPGACPPDTTSANGARSEPPPRVHPPARAVPSAPWHHARTYLRLREAGRRTICDDGWTPIKKARAVHLHRPHHI